MWPPVRGHPTQATAHTEIDSYYSGDPNFISTNSGSQTLQVVQATSTALTSTANPATAGVPVGFTATVSPATSLGTSWWCRTATGSPPTCRRVVRRIFAAGLSLQSVLAMATQAEVRRRVESSVADLDDAIRLLRQAIFGLENRMATGGLRHRILQLCAEVSPEPEITFAGPVDEALSAEASDQMLGMLRAALGQLGTPPQALVCVEAAECLSVTVTGPGPAAEGTRLAWSVPLRS